MVEQSAATTLALVLGLCTACSSNIETGPDPDDLGPLCFSGGEDPSGPLRTLALSPVGDRLYLDIETSDHGVRSLILDLVDPERAVLVADAQQLAHAADQRAWTPLGGTRYARFSAESVIEMLDATDVDRPRIASTVFVDGWTAMDGAIGVEGDTLFFCAADSGGYGRTLLRIDVSDLDHPGEAIPTDGDVCYGAAFSRAVGSLWADIGRNELDGIHDGVAIYALGNRPRLIASHSYDERDYSTYGYMEEIVVGDRLAAAWPEDDDFMFLYGEGVEGGFAVVPNAGRFRAIVGDVGYGATGWPVRLESFDLRDPNAITPIGTEVTFSDDLVWDGSELQFAGHNDENLYLLSLSGDIFVVPRTGSGPAAPLRVYAAPGSACPAP